MQTGICIELTPQMFAHGIDTHVCILHAVYVYILYTYIYICMYIDIYIYVCI